MLDPDDLRVCNETTQELRVRFTTQFRGALPGALRIEPGWIPILQGLFERIDSLSAVARLRFSWTSIHEKYGELRADWTCDRPGDSLEERALYESLHMAIDSAERDSMETCQVCSRPRGD
jgi:hypothetical protein